MKTSRMWLKRAAMLSAMAACALAAQGVLAGDDVATGADDHFEDAASLKPTPTPRVKAMPKTSADTYEATGDLGITMRHGDTMRLYFDIDKAYTRITSARLVMYMWDVDYPSATEQDNVYFNGTYLGRLEGLNNGWDYNYFDVPISKITVPSSGESVSRNTVTINVSVNPSGWVTQCGSAQLIINGDTFSLTASRNMTGGISVNWDNVYGSYDLWRKGPDDSDFTRIRQGITTNGCFDADVQIGKPYTYYAIQSGAKSGGANATIPNGASNTDEGLTGQDDQPRVTINEFAPIIIGETTEARLEVNVQAPDKLYFVNPSAIVDALKDSHVDAVAYHNNQNETFRPIFMLDGNATPIDNRTVRAVYKIGTDDNSFNIHKKPSLHGEYSWTFTLISWDGKKYTVRDKSGNERPTYNIYFKRDMDVRLNGKNVPAWFIYWNAKMDGVCSELTDDIVYDPKKLVGWDSNDKNAEALGLFDGDKVYIGSSIVDHRQSGFTISGVSRQLHEAYACKNNPNAAISVQVTCAHEKQHRYNRNNYHYLPLSGVDSDRHLSWKGLYCDSLTDGMEEVWNGIYGLNLDINNVDTYNLGKIKGWEYYARMGDDELLARIKGGEYLNGKGVVPERDFAYPGMQLSLQAKSGAKAKAFEAKDDLEGYCGGPLSDWPSDINRDETECFDFSMIDVPIMVHDITSNLPAASFLRFPIAISVKGSVGSMDNDGDVYLVKGYLADTNGNPVAWTMSSVEFTNATMTVNLDFDGPSIYSSHNSGFTLKAVEIFLRGGDVVMVLGRKSNLGSTDRVIAYSEFTNSGMELLANESRDSVSADGLNVDLMFENAATDLPFVFEASLSATNGNEIIARATTSNVFSTSSGQAVRLAFPKAEIAASGIDGQYRVSSMTVSATGAVLTTYVDIYTTTNSYRAADFLDGTECLSFIEGSASFPSPVVATDGKFGKLPFVFSILNEDNEAIECQIAASLCTVSNKLSVATTLTSAKLTNGINEVSLSFPSSDIAAYGYDGPYKVELTVSPKGSRGNRLRIRPDVVTGEYKADDFGKTPVELIGTPVVNASGSAPVVTLTVEGLRDCVYNASAVLLDSNREFVAYAVTTNTIAAGVTNTVTLVFDEAAIIASGHRGPYILDYVMLEPQNGADSAKLYSGAAVSDIDYTIADAYVDAVNGSDSNGGTSWSDAYQTIQAAVNVSMSGDTILVADGTYAPFQTGNKEITIRSKNGPRYTIIDGGGTNRCATLGTSAGQTNTVLRGFTLRNGNADGSAVTVSRNYGGGAYCGTLENCSVVNNSAVCGGGVCGGVLSNCRICGNEASNGGGAYGGTYPLKLDGCVVAYNMANGSYGGGAYCANSGTAGSFVVSNSFIYCNVAVYGGGIYSSSSMAANSGNGVWNTVVARNTARNSSGGIYYTAAYESFVWNNRAGRGNADNESNPGFVDGEHCVFRMADAAAEGCVIGIETEGWGGIMEPGEVIPIGGSYTFTAVERGRPFVCFMTNGVWATDAKTLTLDDIRGDILVKAVFEKKTMYADASRPDDSGDGFATATAKRTLQAAINAAKDGETIIAAAGTYGPIYTVNRPLLIQSAAGYRDTLIDGGGTKCCALLGISGYGDWYTNSVLCGFTLTSGWDALGGGARSGWLKRCCIVGNKSIDGGGAAYSHLDNCLVANNEASGGGGVHASYCVNCTIIGNNTGNGYAVSGSRSCRNSIIWENYSNGETANFSGTAYNCITRPLPNGSGNRDIDPMLADAANGDGRLRIGSPCIDAGNNAYVSDGFDIDGKERISGASVDIGAYEGGEVEGFLVGISVDGAGVVSNSALYVSAGGSATIEAVETVRPFLYWVVNGEEITNRVHTITNITSDIRAIAVFGTFDWYVDAEYGDDANDGSDWDAAKRTLQAAVEAAVDDETIYVEAGTYEPISTDNKRIRIESMNGAEMTFIDGGGTNRCATLGKAIEHGYTGEYVGYVGTELAGFTLLNGRAFDFGGGACGGSLEYCIISNCVAQGSGNIYGGGTFYGTLQNCLVAFNRSVSTSASGYAYGGGTYYTALHNCTVSKNRAEAQTGAYGGGTYGSYSAFNSIIWGNEAQGSEVYGENARYTYLYYCCTDGTDGYRYSGTITNDPQFVDADAGDFHLKVGSPCLNAGYNGYVQGDIDLDWDDRIQGSAVDMGCYEGAEYAAPPGQVTGLVAVRGVLRWDAMPDADGFMVYRSTRRVASSAKYIGMADTNTYTDETAVDGTVYYYWVTAFNTLGMGARSDVAENSWPILLAITTPELPEATEMVEYSAQLEATGGTAPYSWEVGMYGYAVSREASSFRDDSGAAQGWNADDNAWPCNLPFAFPFYGKTYTNLYVSSNGTISFGKEVHSWSYSESTFKATPMISVLWSDLTTSGTGFDVFVEANGTCATIRWRGTYLGGQAVNFSATLYDTGDIRLAYGAGNANGGYIGVSVGDGQQRLLVGSSGTSWANVQDVVFSAGAFVPSAAALPSGVSFSASGLLHGTPTEAGTVNIVFRVMDLSGGHDIRELPFRVAANPNKRPVIESATPANAVTFVKVGDSRTFSVAASDPEGSPLSYRWTVDGENVEGADAECYAYRPSADDAGNVHVLTCYVSDDLWTDKVLTNWTVKVPRTIYVDVATTNEEWVVDGSSPELAFPYLSRALDYAEVGDTILVASGAYNEYLNFRSYGIGYEEPDAFITIRSMEGSGSTVLTGTIRNYNYWEREDWARYYHGGGYYEQSPTLPVLEGFTLCCSAVQGVSLVNCSVKGGDDGAETSSVSGCRLSNCTVTGCSSSYGLLYSCELTRCTVAGNTVPAGCFAVDEGSLIIDSIVHGNKTAAGVEANYNPSIYQGYAWEETEDGYREWTVDVPCVVFTNSCTYPLPTMAGSDGNIADDPRLVDVANGDLRLRVGSPCIVNGIQTMGADLGEPVAGAVVAVRVEGHGAVSPMTAVVSDGRDVTFDVSDFTRQFIGFYTNGVFATSAASLVWRSVTEDGIVTAVFSNYMFHVDAATGSDSNDGLSWATAKASIQSAVGEALDGEVVYVKPGTYGPINSNGKRIRIESVDGKAATIINGGGTNRCATLGSTTNTLVRGFTLTNGKASYGGAAYYGTLENCDVVGNVATSEGGGLYRSAANRCRIVNNAARGTSWYAEGGGAYFGTLRNCLVAGNAADCSDAGRGGGTYYGAHYNCTIVSNSVSGTSCEGGGAYGGSLYNTIVYGNLAANVSNEVSWSSSTFSSLVGVDPLFADGDYRLAAGSPCIDAGSNGYVLDDTDLDGNERIQHYTVDIGCYEYVLTTPERDAEADFAEQMSGTCYGVFVGVGQYTYTSSLLGPTVDATNMQTRCVAKGYWHGSNTVAFLDTAATKSVVRARLASLAAKAEPGDTVLYYQSSHGGNHTSGGSYTKDTYICLHDETYEDYEMASDLMQFAAGVKVVIVLDTCHSAGMFKAMGGSSPASAKSFALRVRELMADRANLRKGAKSGITADDIGWIAAADYNQYSWDSARGGAFTVAMLDGWKTGAADYDGDKRLSFHELWRYAKGIAVGYGGSEASDAQCLNEEVLLSRFAGVPDSSGSGEATETTPVPVAHAWLDSYSELLATFGHDYEEMANAQSPGASGSGKAWPNGLPCYVWQDFVAGTSPTNDTVFTATIRMEGNTPVITWEPDTPELRATRVYRTLGKKTLLDADWTDITNKDKSEYNFFMVTVDLPQ